MLIAVLSLAEAHAFPIVALQRLALPGVVTRPAIVEHHNIARDGFAVGFSSSVINLRHLRRGCLILIIFTGSHIRGTCLLRVLIHPGVFVVSVFCGKTSSVEQLQFASDLSG